jgi:uncharacterized protein YbjT (DUF2867 family)
MRVLVTGATGGLGRLILAEQRPPGVVLRALSRRPRPSSVASSGAGASGRVQQPVEWAEGQLTTGEGLAAALEGVDAVIHAASDVRHGDADVQGTRELLQAAGAAGVGHFIYVSIVGVDEIPLPYYRHKLAAEREVAAGAVPYSILRAAQFHSLLDWLLGRAARVPLLMPLPAGFQCQSVATGDVARRLLRCLGEGPRRRLLDFVGPEVMTLEQAATAWREVKGVRKPLVNVPLPGALAAAFRAGKNTVAGGERGSLPWRDWLLARQAAARAARGEQSSSSAA